MKTLSIIVPVYNVEKYLDKCLNSLVNQRIDDYEIIVVNDGTKDNSQLIIDEYVKNYPDKVKSFIKENGGLSDARNFGLKHAIGKYLSFIDSDDYVDEDYYSSMIELAEKDNLDLVVADIEYVWENNQKEPMVKEGINEKVSSNTNKALFLSPLSVCNKLFRRELFTNLNLQFYEGLWYEDIPVDLVYCANSKSIQRVNGPKYHYLQRSTSILGSGYSIKMYDIFTIFERVTKSFKDYNLLEQYKNELEYLYIEHFLLYGAFRFLRTDHYKELMTKAFNFVKEQYPNWKKNKYISSLGIKNRFFLSSNNNLSMGFWHWYLSRGIEIAPVLENKVFISNIAPENKYDKEYKLNLSIVVPVYNVENYLDKCLDSLVNQTIKNYEVIVVNDGTKDDSQRIIDKYVTYYPNLIKSFIKENGGLADARNFGVKYARGKYICFVDSDDYVERDYYEGAFNLAEKNKLDLVVSDLEYVWENNEKAPMLKEGLNEIGGEINKQLFLSPLFAWNKLYRRELFDRLECQYPKGLWYEDIPVTLKVFANSNRIGYYHHVSVHYLQRSTSILGSGYSDKMFDIFEIFERFTKEFKDSNLFNEYKEEIEYLYIEHFLVYGAFRFLRTDHYKELMTKAFSFVKKEFPRYRRNKYIKTFGFKNRIFLITNNKATLSFWHRYLS